MALFCVLTALLILFAALSVPYPHTYLIGFWEWAKRRWFTKNDIDHAYDDYPDYFCSHSR